MAPPTPTKRLGRTFLRGLFTLLPIVVTIWLGAWLYIVVESMLGGALRAVLPEGTYRRGFGILAGVILAFVAGLVAGTPAGRRLLAEASNVIAHVPIAGAIYASLRDLAGFFTRRGKGRLRKVVVVTIGDGRTRLVGFVTREDLDGLPPGVGGKDDVAVYLPMGYQIGGFTVFVPRSAIHDIEMTMEEAMRHTLIAWVAEEDRPK